MEHKISASEAEELLKVSQQAVNKKLKEIEGVQRAQGRVFFGHEVAKTLFKFNFTPQIFAFHIVKGGTGKTSLTQSIGIRANLFGARVLFIDLDHQANLTQSLGVDAHERPILSDLISDDLAIEDLILDLGPGLSLIPSRMENVHADFLLTHKQIPLERFLPKLLRPLKERFDFILIDCPPALGPTITSITLAADKIVLPITPDGFSMRALACNFKEYDAIEKNFERHIDRKILINRFDSRTSMSHEVLKQILQHKTYAPHVLPGYIRTNQEFTVCSHGGRTIYDSLKQSPAKEDVDIIVKRLLGITEPATENEVLRAVATLPTEMPSSPLLEPQIEAAQ